MREIKFRVWDEGEKRFWHFLLQDILERRIVYRGSWDEKVARYQKTQYTGLKDKNGVEIYEGDVVQDSTEQNYVASYDEERAAFILIWCSNDDRFETFEYQKTLKVIGNIYENPELAEDVSL